MVEPEPEKEKLVDGGYLELPPLPLNNKLEENLLLLKEKGE